VDESVGAVADQLRGAAAVRAVPESVLLAHANVRTQPTVGQIWRVRWEDTIELVLLVGVAGMTVRAAPVTEDLDYADEATVVLPATQCPLQVGLAVWLGLQRDLPTRVLDRAFGVVSQTWCEAALDGDEVMLERGSEVVLALDLRHQYRAQLQDKLALLAAAEWVPAGDGTLGSLFSGHDVRPRELANLLGIATPAALSLARGELFVTAEQADALAGRLQLTAAEVMASNPLPPEAVCVLVDLPRHRPQVDLLATQRGTTTDVEAHRAAAYGSWALAARQTGVVDESVWEQRLQQYFTVALHG